METARGILMKKEPIIEPNDDIDKMILSRKPDDDILSIASGPLSSVKALLYAMYSARHKI